MRSKARVAKKNPPYLYEYYNVFGYYSTKSSGTRHTIGRILNTLIVGLNTRDRLPCYVVLMLDKDLIDDINVFGDEAEDEIVECIGWLFRQIEMYLHHRRQEIIAKKLGAVYGSDPKIIVVNMLRHPLRFPRESCTSAIMGLCVMFNSIMNDAAEHFGFNCLYVEGCNTETLYDCTGNLNDYGKVTFWCEVNDLIEKFDSDKVKLKPKKYEKEIARHMKRKANREPKH